VPDFKSLQDTYPRDRDYPERTFRLQALTRVIDGTMYDLLQHPFSEEETDGGEYVPLDKRRPSARTRICSTVVSDSVSLLFSDGHFPAVECTDEATRDALTKLIADTSLNAVMIDAASRGAVGSVAIVLRVLKYRVFFGVMPTAYLTPTWAPDAPDTLTMVRERYKVRGRVLADMGYTIDEEDLGRDFWWTRDFDAQAETWYQPQSLKDAKDGLSPVADASRSTSHNLGFVPVVWIRNLPGCDGVDGAPTFPGEAIDMQIEADYLLSQGGRGLKYQSDPTLHIKQPAVSSGPIVKGAANALITSADGDAKLLEISGDAANSVMEWVKGLRELALEGAGGNRSNADKLSAAQSGRAMELMNQALIWLADKLRISYGQNGLLDLLNMVVAVAQKVRLVDKKGRAYGPMSPTDDISLRWPNWYAPTYADKQTEAVTLTTLRDGGLLSRETAVKALAPAYDIADPADELRQIDADPPTPSQAAAQAKQVSLQDAAD
jgi:hypothetical protein